MKIKEVLHKYSGKTVSILNVFIFFCFMTSSAFLLWRGQVQYAFDILFALCFYVIFTKLEKMEGNY